MSEIVVYNNAPKPNNQQPQKPKKPRKKVVQIVEKTRQKAPSQSKNPAARVGKNLLRQHANAADSLDIESKKMFLEVFHALTDPENSKNIRLGSGYGTSKTSVANVKEVFDAQFASVNLGATPLDFTAFMFPDPFCYSIVTEVVAAPIVYSYSGAIHSPGSTTGNGTNAVGINSGMPFKIAALFWQSGKQIHGNTMWPGRLKNEAFDGYNWFYAQSTDSIVLTKGGGATVFNLVLYRWWNDDITEISTTRFNGPVSNTINITQQGYYTFRIVNGATAVQPPGDEPWTITWNISATAPNTSLYWSHKALPEVDKNIATTEALRVVSMSMLISNTAPEQYKNGELAAYQIQAGENPFEYPNYAKLATLPDAVTLPAKNGCYTFRKNTQPSDFDYRVFNSNQVSFTGYTDCFYWLQKDRDFVAFSARVPIDLGQSFKCTWVVKIQCKTTNPWFSTSPAYIPQWILDLVCQYVSKCPQVFENPFHIEDLWNFIKDVTKGVVNTAKELHPYLVTGLNVAKALGAA